MRLAAAVMALFGLAFVAQPVLANEEAYAFIEKVYATYEEGDGHGIPLEGPTLRDHFTEELATMIEEDAKLGEQKRMNYDPLADAEEWEIYDIRITIRELTYDHVLAAVNFYSYLEARLVNVDLVKTRNGWRIDDIQVPDGRLRELFTEDPEADDDDEVAVDGGPTTTESVSESRASAMGEPATPPIHLSGDRVPLPRPVPIHAEPKSPDVEPPALEAAPAVPAEPAGDIPGAVETAAAPLDTPAVAPASLTETPAEPVVPEASAPADMSDQPAAMPAGPATEAAKPADAAPVEPAPPPSVAPREYPRKAAKPPEKEKRKKKAVAPRKGKPKHVAKPKAPPAAPPSPPPAAEKPPAPPASGAPRFSVTRVPPPPAAKPAKPPVQAAAEKAPPKVPPNRSRPSLP